MLSLSLSRHRAVQPRLQNLTEEKPEELDQSVANTTATPVTPTLASAVRSAAAAAAANPTETKTEPKVTDQTVAVSPSPPQQQQQQQLNKLPVTNQELLKAFTNTLQTILGAMQSDLKQQFSQVVNRVDTLEIQVKEIKSIIQTTETSAEVNGTHTGNISNSAAHKTSPPLSLLRTKLLGNHSHQL